MGLTVSKNITTARRTADRWFGLYVRLRDMDADSHEIECITCGKSYPFGSRKIDCSHWIEKSIEPTRWHPHNANAACKGCNMSDNGKAAYHGKEIALKYGKEIPDDLIELSKGDTSYDKEQVMALAREFKALAEELAIEKGVEL